MNRIKPLNMVDVVISLLESGVNIETVRNAFVRGGFNADEVNYLIGYIDEMESDKLINLAYQYLNSLEENLNSVVNLFSKAK